MLIIIIENIQKKNNKITHLKIILSTNYIILITYKLNYNQFKKYFFMIKNINLIIINLKININI